MARGLVQKHAGGHTSLQYKMVSLFLLVRESQFGGLTHCCPPAAIALGPLDSEFEIHRQGCRDAPRTGILPKDMVVCPVRLAVRLDHFLNGSGSVAQDRRRLPPAPLFSKTAFPASGKLEKQRGPT